MKKSLCGVCYLNVSTQHQSTKTLDSYISIYFSPLVAGLFQIRLIFRGAAKQ